jgi:hypothetical protein
MARGKLAAIAVATGSVIGTVALRRRRRLHQTRVDLYFGDGSMLSLPDDAPETAAILPAAHAILAAAT